MLRQVCGVVHNQLMYTVTGRSMVSHSRSQTPVIQVQNARSVWGLVLQEHRAKDLFREMKKDPQLRSLLYRRHEVTIYALEE